MKIVEIFNKIQLAINNEEAELLERFVDSVTIAKSQLTEREQLLANQLTVKDVLLRTNEDGKIYYKKRTG
jgi:hypothetical protein